MKIDRLIGILSILLQQEKVTAPYLAGKFEVSRRTISRDIEHLCKAGIPVFTMQGQNGGISIMEGFRLDRTLLTSGDMQAILTGLRSLDSVSGTARYQQLMEKLSVGNSNVLASNEHILIDLSSWNKASLAPKIEQIQTAIKQQEKISFTYYAPGGESKRIAEPYLLIFQWSSWYLWGYCMERHAYRLFKLNRMQALSGISEKFEKRQILPPDLSAGQVFPAGLEAEVIFKPEMKWRLIEEFGIESFTEREDGMLLFRGEFTDKEYLFYWLLSFGSRAELLFPKELRKELYETAEKIKETYRDE